MKYLNHIKSKIFLREGHLILLANLIDKVVNFIIMIIAARYMSISTYGNFSYIKSIITTMTPFAGLGGNHALLRFGMDTEDIKEKYNLLFSALVFGSFFTVILLSSVKILFSHYDFLETGELAEIFNIYIFFVLSYYIYDVVRNYYRINLDNRTYAISSIRYALLTLVLGSLALIIFDYVFFLVVIAVLPIIITLIDNRRILFKNMPNIKFEKPFWNYGALIGLGAFLNQFFMQSDILILGFLSIEPEFIAQYKVATLLVYTFVFIPNTFLVRDFTILSSHAADKIFLVEYVYTYLKYSSVILIFIVPLFYISSHTILIFLFGEKFQNDLEIQNILIIGLISIVMLRMLFGNILNAVGKANLNVINTIFTIILAIPMLFFLTKEYGIIGTAYSMVIVFFCSGIVSLSMFIYYIRNIKG